MNSTTSKIAVTVVVIFMIAAGALALQVWVPHWGGSGGNVSAAQMEAFVATLPPQQQSQIAQSDDQRKAFAKQIQQLLAVGQDALDHGFDKKDPETATQLDLQKTIVLAQEYQRWAQKNNQTADVSDEEGKNYEKAHPGEFDAFFDKFSKSNPRLQQLPPEQKDGYRKQYYELMILSQRAKDKKLDRDPGIQIEQRVAAAQILVQPYIKELQTTLTVPDDKLHKYYDDHKAEYEQIHARHILISTGPPPGGPQAGGDDAKKPVDKDAARKKAEDLDKQAKSGKDFVALAKENTDEPQGKENGGDLGYFTKGKMVPQFESAAFALQPGQISDVVESQFGFHVIKVEDRRIAPFDDVKPEIEEKLKVDAFKDKIDEITKKSKIQVAQDFKVSAPASGVESLPGGMPPGHQ